MFLYLSSWTTYQTNSILLDSKPSSLHIIILPAGVGLGTQHSSLYRKSPHKKSNYNQKAVWIECNQIKGNQLIILTLMLSTLIPWYIYLHNGEILRFRPNNFVSLLVLTLPITLIVLCLFSVKCGRRALRVGFTWELVWSTESQPKPRPGELESANSPVIQLLNQVWEALS